MKKLLALVMLSSFALVSFSCSAEDPVPAPGESIDIGQVEQAAVCPQNVYCPGTPAYSYSAGTKIACMYIPGGLQYVNKPAACQQCCPTWSVCTPGGCGGNHAMVVSWTCRTGGSCSP